MSSVVGRDSRSQILLTAKQLFIQKGFHGLSMREIAEQVGVTKAALYYHFDDKEQLFLEILNTYLEEVEPILDLIRAGEGTISQKIKKLVRAILTQPANQRALIRVASQEMPHLSAQSREEFGRTYHDKFINKIQEILNVGIERGEFRPFDTQVCTWVLLGMMYPYFFPAHYRDVPPAESVIDQIVTIYLKGISSSE